MSRRLRNLANQDESEESDDIEESEDDVNLNLGSEDDEEEGGNEELVADEDREANLFVPSDDSDEDDDDDAPEDVGFNVSKGLALKNIQDAINVLKNEKIATKNKRKKKEELFVKQKKTKLAELDKTKLPDDILQAVAGKTLFKYSKDKKLEDEKKNSRITFDDEVDYDITSHRSEEYIPLNSSKGLVVKAIKSKNQVSDTATDFRHKMLYGGRVKRIDAKGLQRQEAKRRARYV